MKIALLAAALCGSIAVAANAAVIEWTVENATFDTGGSVTGSFYWDNTTDTIVSNTIMTSPDGITFLSNYDFSTRVGALNDSGRILFTDTGGGFQLNLISPVVFADALDDPSNTLILSGFENGFYQCNVTCSTVRRGSADGVASLSGRLVPDGSGSGGEPGVIPVPAALPILVSALCGLGLLRSRRRLGA